MCSYFFAKTYHLFFATGSTHKKLLKRCQRLGKMKSGHVGIYLYPCRLGTFPKDFPVDSNDILFKLAFYHCLCFFHISYHPNSE